MSDRPPRPTLPPSSPWSILFGAGCIAVLATMSAKKRARAISVMDRVLRPTDTIRIVEVIRGRSVELDEQFREACAWWQTFRPLIAAEAERFAED